MAQLHVEVVSPEQEIWSGEADLVIARTVEGEIGILPGHAPLLGLLAEGGVVRIRSSAQEVVAAVHGGFVSVTDEGVRILAERAELAGDIDTGRAQSALERARSGMGDGDETAAETARAAARRAEGRLRAAGQSAT